MNVLLSGTARRRGIARVAIRGGPTSRCRPRGKPRSKPSASGSRTFRSRARSRRRCRRARRTAEAILVGRTTPLELDDRLLEISHGGWEGQLATDIELSHAEMFGTWRTNPERDVPAGPGAETLGDVERRAWPRLARPVRLARPRRDRLDRGHDAVNRALICRVLGLPLSRVWMFRQAPATLNVLSGPSFAELQLVRLNDSEHASPLLSEALHRAL